jgi:hypothetical protein
METLPGVAPPEQQNTYFYIGQHEMRRTVPVTTELGNQAQDAGVSSLISLCYGCLETICDSDAAGYFALFVLAVWVCDELFRQSLNPVDMP